MDLVVKLVSQLLFLRSRMNFEPRLGSQNRQEVLKVLRRKGNLKHLQFNENCANTIC